MHNPITPPSVRPLVVPELVTCPAEIDINNADEIGELLRATFRPHTAVVIADLTGTVFCDSTGAGMLLRVAEHAEKSHAQLRLVADGAVLRILTILGFDRLLRIYPTLTAALTGPAGTG